MGVLVLALGLVVWNRASSSHPDTATNGVLIRDTYVRHVPEGAAAGPSARYLTVAPPSRATPTATSSPPRPGQKLKAGALLVLPAGTVTSAEFAVPNFNLPMEVYDPLGQGPAPCRACAMRPVA